MNLSLKLTDLIDHLLDLSSLQAGSLRIHIESGSVAKIMKTAQPQLEALAVHHQLQIGSFADLPLVKVDVQRIAQVLVNLVGNAAKYSPPETLITVSFSTSDNVVQVNVTDQGPGIPVAYRQIVFDPFLQLKSTSGVEHGVGLGLSLCKGLIERHHGTIWIADVPEGETTISFTLPVAT